MNVPTEIARTVLAIAEVGSFSKAAEKLGLSQPAISAQIKRLQVLVGGQVFQKQAFGGLEFTPRGQIVLTLSRKLIEVSDQILSLGGALHDRQPVRLGLAGPYVQPFFDLWRRKRMDLNLHIFSDSSSAICKGLSEGFIDAACMFAEQLPRDCVVEDWAEDFVWARHPSFVLSPGAPIPLVSWPGSFADSPFERQLDRSGVAYRVVFASADHHARMAAANSCFGVIGLPRRWVSDPLTVANDHYLPKLSPIRAAISVRSGFNVKRNEGLLGLLREMKAATPH